MGDVAATTSPLVMVLGGDDSKENSTTIDSQESVETTLDDISKASEAVAPLKSALVTCPNEARKSRVARIELFGAEEDAEGNLTVQFADITIREYPISLGDSPGAAQVGPPLSVEWKHEAEVTLKISDYEEQRPPRRSGREMIVPVEVRTTLLREAGFSKTEIQQAVKAVNITRGQRRRTCETLQLQPIYALKEKMSRGAWNTITLGKHKRKQREFLKKYKQDSASNLVAAAATISTTTTKNATAKNAATNTAQNAATSTTAQNATTTTTTHWERNEI